MAASTPRRAASGQLLDEWSVREKLVLACSVIRSGDQNWASVTRTIKPICEAVQQRPSDWFGQRNCANQYADLLENTSTKKRKRTTSTSDIGVANETPQEQILRRLTFERVDELKKSIDADREKFKKLKSDIEKIRSGKIDDQLTRIWGDIQNMQSGVKRFSIDQLITEIKQEPLMGGFGSSPLCSAAVAGSTALQQQQLQQANIHRGNRSQRVPKTTKKFETWMSQLKQQQARHQHQHQQHTGILHGNDQHQHTGILHGNEPHQQQHIGNLPGQIIPSGEPPTPPGRLPEPPQPLDSHNVIRQLMTQLSAPPHMQPKQQPKQMPQPTSSALQITARRLTIDTTSSVPSSTMESSPSPVLSSLLIAPPPELKLIAEKQSNRDQMTIQPASAYMDRPLPTTIPNSVPLPKESLPAYKPPPQPSKSPPGLVSASAPFLSKLLESVPRVSSPTREDNIGPPKIQTPSVTEGLESMKIKIPITNTKDTTNMTPCVPRQPGGMPVKISASTSLLKLVSSPPIFRYNTTVPDSMSDSIHQIPSSGASPPDGPLAKRKPVELPRVLPLQPYKQTLIIDDDIFCEPTASQDQRPTTIIIPDNTDVLANSSPRGRSRKSRGRFGRSRRKGQPQQLLLKTFEQLSQQDDDTVSIDDLTSERDDTESEIASVSDTKDLPDMEQMEDDSHMEDDDDIKLIEGGEARDLMMQHRRAGRGKGAASVSSICSAAVSPSSPALSTGSNYDAETAQAQKNWRKSIILVWKAVASHKYATVFMHPVTDDEAPGYHNIVYRPMDLSTIKKNIENGRIRTSTEFQRDMMLMFQNALMYNRADHDVYRMAEEMREEVMEQIETFIATQLHMIVQSTDKETLPMLRGHRSQVFHFFL